MGPFVRIACRNRHLVLAVLIALKKKCMVALRESAAELPQSRWRSNFSGDRLGRRLFPPPFFRDFRKRENIFCKSQGVLCLKLSLTNTHK